MSGSLTVIGGHSGSTLTGLVNIPLDQTPLTLAGFGGVTGLQDTLTGISDAVTTGSASFDNVNAVSGTSAPPTTGSDSTSGLYEITNTDSTGAVSPGSVPSGTFTVGQGYSTLIVQAPGVETVTGNNSTNFLAIFSAQSTVTFNSREDINNVAAGTGTIIASGSNRINVGGTYANGQGWTILGGASGNDTINTIAENTSITTQGANNVVGLGGGAAGAATVVAGGTNDLIASYSGNDIVSVTGSGDNVLVQGAADTVYAAVGSSSLNTFFFGSGSGTLDFINQSGVAASVTGGANGASGSVTVFAGSGGGYYQGGTSGNNSLVGSSGTAATTLIGGGNGNFLSVDGSGKNALFANGNAGNATLVAGSFTQDNDFIGGTGTDIMSSEGAGNQSFFIGTQGGETLTGSSVSGALNYYYVNQASTDGGAQDVITNFSYGAGTAPGADQVFINPFSGGGVSVSGVQESADGKSSLVELNDGTTLKLLGVTFTAAEAASIIGSTHF